MKPISESPDTLTTRFGQSVLEASWVGSTAHSRLVGGVGEGIIHGVFDGAINILLAGGLVSLVPQAVGRGPLNLTLRLPAGPPRMSSIGVRIGDKVKVRGPTLELGDCGRVSFRFARIYSPGSNLARQMVEEDEIAANLEVATKAAVLCGNMAGLGGLLGMLRPGMAGEPYENLNIFASAALHRVVRLEEAFFAEDENLMEDAVSGLVGLGPGLTPSSDDMLAGLVLLCVLYAENHGFPRRASRLIAQAALTAARGRTTTLSEEFLIQAALGRGNEPVMRLCTALLTGGQKSVERETRRVLSIGETSGTDTVLGILLGTILCAGRRSGFARREFG